MSDDEKNINQDVADRAKELIAAAARWRKKTQERIDARDALVTAIQHAADVGMTDTQIARTARIHRMQARRWLGKSR